MRVPSCNPPASFFQGGRKGASAAPSAQSRDPRSRGAGCSPPLLGTGGSGRAEGGRGHLLGLPHDHGLISPGEGRPPSAVLPPARTPSQRTRPSQILPLSGGRCCLPQHPAFTPHTGIVKKNKPKTCWAVSLEAPRSFRPSEWHSWPLLLFCKGLLFPRIFAGRGEKSCSPVPSPKPASPTASRAESIRQHRNPAGENRAGQAAAPLFFPGAEEPTALLFQSPRSSEAYARAGQSPL